MEGVGCMYGQPLLRVCQDLLRAHAQRGMRQRVVLVFVQDRAHGIVRRGRRLRLHLPSFRPDRRLRLVRRRDVILFRRREMRLCRHYRCIIVVRRRRPLGRPDRRLAPARRRALDRQLRLGGRVDAGRVLAAVEREAGAQPGVDMRERRRAGARDRALRVAVRRRGIAVRRRGVAVRRRGVAGRRRGARRGVQAVLDAISLCI